MENSAENADKKATKTGKNNKTKKKRWNMLGQKEKKATQEKITIQLEEINQKVLVKEGRLKRYRQRVKQYGQNRKFKNNKKKFYQQVARDDMKTYQQLDAREAEQFWSKIWQLREHNKKSQMDNPHGERVRRTRIRTESGNTHRLTENDTKNIKLENATPYCNT